MTRQFPPEIAAHVLKMIPCEVDALNWWIANFGYNYNRIAYRRLVKQIAKELKEKQGSPLISTLVPFNEEAKLKRGKRTYYAVTVDAAEQITMGDMADLTMSTVKKLRRHLEYLEMCIGTIAITDIIKEERDIPVETRINLKEELRTVNNMMSRFCSRIPKLRTIYDSDLGDQYPD